jgi:hypothetical protein
MLVLWSGLDWPLFLVSCFLKVRRSDGLSYGLIGRIGGDEGFFGFRGDNLNVDVILAGEEEALAYWEVGESFLLLAGEFVDVA